jgi:plastocyanin
MRRREFIGVVALLLGGATTAAQSTQKPTPKPKPEPRTHTVTIGDMTFTPQTLTVAAGDTVVWVNTDLVPHTATSPDGVFDSKSIAPNASWRYTARKKGAYAYTCTFHPTMKAMLRVT